MIEEERERREEGRGADRERDRREVQRECRVGLRCIEDGNGSMGDRDEERGGKGKRV